MREEVVGSEANGEPVVPMRPSIPELKPVELHAVPFVPLDVDDDMAADAAAAADVQTRSASSHPDAAEPPASTMELLTAVAEPVVHPTGAAADPEPPSIPLAPLKRVQARFNPLADAVLYAVVFVGGCLGTGLRYGTSLLWPAPHQDGSFPSALHGATFVVNMVACLLYAYLSAYMSQASWLRKRVREVTSHGVGMGFCGGLSTLSAMVVENISALQHGQYAGVVTYTLGSFVCGGILAWIGMRAATSVAADRAARSVIQVQLDDQGGDMPPAAPVSALVSKAGVRAGAHGEVTLEVASERSAMASLPAFEPTAATDEIPVVADPASGEVR